MRTSATGIAEQERGFTLVELLVVLMLIGLFSAAVVLALPGGRSALMADAEEFASRAKAVRDQSMIEARSTSIRVTSLGYAFDRRERGGWRPINGDLTQGMLWREGTQALVPSGQTVRITFDSTGVVEPAQVVLRRGEDQVLVTIAYDGTIDVAT